MILLKVRFCSIFHKESYVFRLALRNASFSAKVQLYRRKIAHHGFISTGFLCHFSSQMFLQQLIAHLSSLPWRWAMKREKKHLMKNKRRISNSRVGSDQHLTGVTVWHGPCVCYCASTAWCILQYWETGRAVWWYQGRLGVHIRGFI